MAREEHRPYAGGAPEERGADKEARRDLGRGYLLASGHYTKRRKKPDSILSDAMQLHRDAA